MVDDHILECLLVPLNMVYSMYDPFLFFFFKGDINLTVCDGADESVYGYSSVEKHFGRHGLLSHKVAFS
jgi:hypothetical protein